MKQSEPLIKKMIEQLSDIMQENDPIDDFSSLPADEKKRRGGNLSVLLSILFLMMRTDEQGQAFKAAFPEYGKIQQTDVSQFQGTETFSMMHAFCNTVSDFLEGENAETFESSGDLLYSALEKMRPMVEEYSRRADLFQADGGQYKNISALATNKNELVPADKTFWRQNDIAQCAGAPVLVDVGEKEHVYINAAIHDGHRQPLHIDELKLAIQIAIGQMIKNNGKPLTVTISQIARATFGADCQPSQEQINKCQEAMDALITAPAQIDFQEQLEKFKNLNRVEGENYGNLLGTLIPGIRLEDHARYRGEKVKNYVYVIYDMPMFIHYSYLVNRLRTVSREDLAENRWYSALPEKHPDKQKIERSAANIVVRKYLYQLFTKEITTDGEDGKKKKAKSKKKGTPPLQILFETIANRCGIEDTPRKMRTLQKNVFTILNDFKTSGLLAGFENKLGGKSGRKVVGVVVTFPKEQSRVKGDKTTS